MNFKGYVYLTQAQYQTLKSNNQLDAEKIYVIDSEVNPVYRFDFELLCYTYNSKKGGSTSQCFFYTYQSLEQLQNNSLITSAQLLTLIGSDYNGTFLSIPVGLGSADIIMNLMKAFFPDAVNDGTSSYTGGARIQASGYFALGSGYGATAGSAIYSCDFSKNSNNLLVPHVIYKNGSAYLNTAALWTSSTTLAGTCIQLKVVSKRVI